MTEWYLPGITHFVARQPKNESSQNRMDQPEVRKCVFAYLHIPIERAESFPSIFLHITSKLEFQFHLFNLYFLLQVGVLPHYTSMASDQWNCTECNKVYSSESSFKCHYVKKHLNSKKTWKCQLCEKQLVCKTTLRNHMVGAQFLPSYQMQIICAYIHIAN